MIIGIANDHHGIELKNKITNYLENNNIKVINYGSDTEDSSDYVDYAIKLCKGYQNKEFDLGILICGTGIGMSIVANKMKGIICGKVNTIREAHLIKEHNMANVMSLAENTTNVFEIVDEFINTEYSNEERHIRRVNKIKGIENNN